MMRADGLIASPLTEAQQGLWFFQSLDPANPILNTGQYLDLHGPLDVMLLRQAFDLAIGGADALRLRFRNGNEGPEQWLAPGAIALEVIEETQSGALEMMRADTDRPLDLARDPLARFILFRINDERHFLYERIHHLAIDGYGMVLVSNQIGAWYSTLTAGLPEPRPFGPLARAFEDDEAYRLSPKRAEDLAWWRDTLRDMPEAQGPAPGRAASGRRFIRESCVLDAGLLGALADLAGSARLGWPDVLTGIVGAYIARWTGGEAVIGMPFMARMGRQTARVPAMVMNVLPQIIRPDEDAPLAEWLRGLAAQMRDARAHGLYRSEQLRRDLGLIGGEKRLYGPLINVQPFDRAPVFAGLKCELNILGAGAVDDLTLTFRGDPKSGMIFEVDANPDLYSAADIAAHCKRIQSFLRAALTAVNLSAVPTASPSEIAKISAWNDTDKTIPQTSLVHLIEDQIAKTPDAPALVYQNEVLSFQDLDARSSALAAQLQGLGAGKDKIVAVALNRSIELPIALFAIMRAGAAYLPLDPEHPPERLARILEMAGPATLITSPDLRHIFPADAPTLMPQDWQKMGAAVGKPAPWDMAYVIYTSGSTGEPKGVVIEHQAIVNRLLWMGAEYSIGAGDRILQKTPATFDVSVWEFFLPMLTGATLVMADPGAHKDPFALARILKEAQITTAHFVPSMLSAFLAAPESEGVTIAKVFCSGEELGADLRDRFHRRIRGQLHNLYGPTEAAVDVSYWEASSEDRSNPVPIGRPVWNTRLEVLDGRMRPVPPGLAGNLFLGGVQLARGYLGRPDLTAARFIADPARPGQRLYDTGDLAKWRADGAVTYLGRSDHQVKIRGLRIELGEIEAAILSSGLVRETIVMAREDGGDKRLVAWVVPDEAYAPGLLADALARSLPAWMIPSAQVVMDKMPVTANGKLDRKALPTPNFSASGRAPETPSEQRLSELYAEILNLTDLPPAEGDFFALGGDSLSAVRLVLRIRAETGRDPGLGAIFTHPDIAGLAQVLDSGEIATGTGPAIRLTAGNPKLAPLFVIHPAGGLAWGYRRLALGLEHPVWGLQHPGMNPEAAMPLNLKALALDYAARVNSIAPEGPIHLAGWSVGGILAQEIAAELLTKGRQIGLVAMLDSYPADVWRDEPDPDPVEALRALLAIAGYDPDAHRDLDSREKVVAFLQAGDTPLGALPQKVLDGVVTVVTSTNTYVRAHHHRHYAGRITHIRAGLDHQTRDLTSALWRDYAAEIESLELPFLHAHMTGPEASQMIAPLLAARMAKA